MTEHPIIFSAPMVRAILDGHKTQTRRVARLTENGYVRRCHRNWHPGDPAAAEACPYGQPGDRLWVRETWRVVSSGRNHTTNTTSIYIEYRERAPAGVFAAQQCSRWECSDADSEALLASAYGKGASVRLDGSVRWRPSIYMPRWASRITLEVLSVRVERLQSITEEDARAEGVDWAAPHPYGERWDDDDREDPREVGYGSGSFALDNFRRLWNTINAKRAPWESNPWVWRVEFRRVMP